MSKEIFEEAGFIPHEEMGGVWLHPALPFEIREVGGYLYITIGFKQLVTKDIIPCNKTRLKGLLEAFSR